MKYLKLTSAAIFVCTTISAQAAQQFTADENIVVTANRSEQSLDSVLSSMTILDRSDIESIQPQSVAELLEHVNGFDIAHNGGAGQKASIFSRGTESNHILVLINGQRLGLANFDTVNFSNISVAQIERIEIIKGPRAALWGSDAIGGVIQIFTRELESGQYSVNINAGSHDTQGFDLAVGAQHGDGQSTLSLSHQQSNGFDVHDDNQFDDDGYQRLGVSLNGTQTITSDLSLNWIAKLDSSNSEFDSSFGGDETDYKQQLYKIGSKLTFGDWQHQLNLSHATETNDTFGLSIPKNQADHYKTTRQQLDWLALVDLNQQLSAGIGIDLYKEKIDTNSSFSVEKKDRLVEGYFTNLNYDNQFLILQGAVRHDKIEGVDSTTSVQLSTGIRATDNLMVSLNYGQGLKAPSFYELSQNNQLEAEESETIELLIRTNYSGISTELNFYKTDFTNFIFYDDATWQYYNIDSVEIQGAELSFNANYLDFNHRVSYSYLDAKNAQTEQQLVRRARHKASYQLSYQWQAVSLSLDYQYHGKRFDNKYVGFTKTRVEMDDYQLLNLSLAYQWDEQWRIQVKANNIADVNYQSIYGYYTSGAEYFINLNYTNF